MRALSKHNRPRNASSAHVRHKVTSRPRAEKTPQDPEASYRLLFEHSPLPMWVYRIDDLKFLAVNEAAIEKYGYGREEFRHITVKDLHPLEDRPRLESDLARRLSNRERSGPWKHLRKNGALIDVEILSQDVSFFQEPARLVLAIDVTTRLGVEVERLRAEEKYRGIFENSTEAITQTTPAGHYLTANPATARMLGFESPEELIAEYDNLDDDLYVKPGRRLEFLRLMEEYGEVSGFESEVHRKDGSTMWISESSKAIRDEQGRLLYYQGMAQDITARKRAEAERREAEEKYRRIFENATEEIIQTTPAGKYLTANPAGARMLGFDSPGQLMAEYDDLDHCFYVKPGRRLEFKALMELHGEVSGFESEVYRRDGSTIWISENSKAIVGEDGNLLYYQGTAQDITERKRIEEQLRQQIRHMEALRRIDATISGTFDLKEMLSEVLTDILQVLEVDAAAVSLLVPESMTLEVVSARGFRTRQIEASPLRLSTDVGTKVLLERRAVDAHDLQRTAKPGHHGSLMEAEGFVFYHGVPLISRGRVTGLLEVFRCADRPLDNDWLRLIDALAAQTSIAVESASMFQDLQRSNVDLALAYEATIEGWSRALDLRDRETEGHTRRVTDWTMDLARSLGVKPDDLAHIRRGALLHDIGKIAIPDSILMKPGPLSDDEWVIMRGHPEAAYKMLSPIAYLGPALDIPYCHHERWDGSGYPRGLKGEQIPLAARIFAVVDVWDALSSERPYRAPWDGEKIIEHLRSESGRHFDPRVTEAFLRLPVDAQGCRHALS